MLTNRELRQYGFLFPNNIDPKYLATLINLGSRPIFIYIKDGKRIISEALLVSDRPYAQLQWKEYIKSYENWCNLNNYDMFNFKRLSVSEIKTVLSMKIIYSCFNIPVLSEVKSFYFFDT